jgi:murein hydrolase activator
MLNRSSLFALLVIAPALIAPASAQSTSPAAALAAAKVDRAKELQVIEENLQKGAADRARIAAEISAIETDRAVFEKDLVETNARVRASEDKIALARARLETAIAQEEALARSLESRRDVIADVLAALQRIGHRPPPAVIVQPGDILDAVRASIQFGAVLPEMRSEAEQLAKDVEALVAARESQAKEQAILASERKSGLADQERLKLLVAARQKDIEAQQRRLEQEEIKSQALAAQARSLKELIGRLESDDAATRMAEEASRLVPPVEGAPVEDPAKTRLSPKVAFESLRGALPLPVAGSMLKTYGEPDGTGGIERGVTISTPASAIVTAPADGTVAFAGPFRSYGTVLIINGGNGYHLVLIGMERANVRVGQFVLAGEPVGVMGRERRASAGEDVTASVSQPAGADAGAPVLYIEMRKDGAPIDSRSWWAATDKAKDG